MRTRRGVAAAFVVLIVAACGGATSSIDNTSSSSSGSSSGGGTSTSGVDGSASADGGSILDLDGGGGGLLDSGDGRFDGGPNDPSPGSVECGFYQCSKSQTCCIATGGNGTAPSCKSDLLPPCTNGHQLKCDDAADCGDGQVCCAEGSGFDQQVNIVTRCLPSCITGAPRYQVCRTDKECESGNNCRAFNCGAQAPLIRYCQKPDYCKN